MNILLVNDDGIESKGLVILARALAPHGKIYVSAPANEQSGKSQAITLANTLDIVEVDTIAGSIRSIKVFGTPADATVAGFNYFNVEFDLVVSGINNGPNIAMDVLYSGTVGAARQARISGVPAIAVSSDGLELEYLYDEVIKTFDEVIENELYLIDGVLNINFPRHTFEKSKGLMFTSVGRRYYHTEMVRKNEKEDTYYIKGSITRFEEETHTDVWAFNNGYTSITPLLIDQTDYAVFKKLNKK